MVDQSSSPSSNRRYRGLIVDIMDELASILNIAYEFQLVNDRRYGRKGHDGNWSGMVGELVRGVSGKEIEIIIVNRCKIYFTLKLFVLNYCQTVVLNCFVLHGWHPV